MIVEQEENSDYKTEKMTKCEDQPPPSKNENKEGILFLVVVDLVMRLL